MGRHGASTPNRATRAPSGRLVVAVVLAIVAIALGVWWWTLQSHSDPIDAAPVDAYAVVVSSPGCQGATGTTVIDLTVAGSSVRTTMNGCGYQPGQRLAVQYLSGHTNEVRLAGTSTAGASKQRRWLPLAILAAGALAVGATFALLMDRRRSRHVAAARRVSVADLQHVAEPTKTDDGTEVERTGDPEMVERTGDAAVVDPSGDAATAEETGAADEVPSPQQSAEPAERVDDGPFDGAVAEAIDVSAEEPKSVGMAAGRPELLGQRAPHAGELFTHSGPEADGR